VTGYHIERCQGASCSNFAEIAAPVGTGSSIRIFQGGNSGSLYRCTSGCTGMFAPFSGVTGGWTGDTRSFVVPYDLFHGGVSGGDDCAAAGTPGGCGHLIAGDHSTGHGA